ncbi:C3a anaphylatoxin chemotactic receptor-like [Hypanus sabinus]|uniref:C3a anaphylatoxin chemotactic receptor-like n=1 Tax=Hypanus sabinus TaxID=79690 RepID=UPI0028C3D32C|nr:C3a anaphylatoxin chemotactic receptor-like [Hypanus sabinus]
MSRSADLFNSTLGGNGSFNSVMPKDFELAPATLSTVSFVITFLLGVPGNCAVIWVTGFKMERRAHTVCFLKLAVADLAYCFTLPFHLAMFFDLSSFPQDDSFFIFFGCVVIINMSVSSFLLTLISIFRSLAVIRPIWFRHQLSLDLVYVSCFGAWVLAFLMSLPHLIFEQIILYFGENTWLFLEVTWDVFIFGLTILIMSTCYIMIGRILQMDDLAKSQKPVRLIVTVVVAFIICWLPNIVCSLLRDISDAFLNGWLTLTFALASFNSALNSLLYVFPGRDFRRVFRRSLTASLHLAFAEEVLPHPAVTVDR